MIRKRPGTSKVHILLLGNPSLRLCSGYRPPTEANKCERTAEGRRSDPEQDFCEISEKSSFLSFSQHRSSEFSGAALMVAPQNPLPADPSPPREEFPGNQRRTGDG